jgi:hypothetical protein
MLAVVMKMEDLGEIHKAFILDTETHSSLQHESSEYVI